MTKPSWGKTRNASTMELDSAVLYGRGLVPTLNGEFLGAQQVGIFPALNQQVRKAPLENGSLQTAGKDEPTTALEGGDMGLALDDEQISEGLRHRLPQPLQPLGASGFQTSFLRWVMRDLPRLLSRFPRATSISCNNDYL